MAVYFVSFLSVFYLEPLLSLSDYLESVWTFWEQSLNTVWLLFMWIVLNSVWTRSLIYLWDRNLFELQQSLGSGKAQSVMNLSRLCLNTVWTRLGFLTYVHDLAKICLYHVWTMSVCLVHVWNPSGFCLVLNFTLYRLLSYPIST